nr:polyadenylate-binding protein-interacting protein 11-like [Ipomoea batatas]
MAVVENGNDGNVQNDVVAADRDQSTKNNSAQSDQSFQNGNGVLGDQRSKVNGLDARRNLQIDEEDGDGREVFKSEKEMRDLEEMLSKLNPMAEEFVPPSLSIGGSLRVVALPPGGGHFANNFVLQQANSGLRNGNSIRRKKNGNGYAKKRMNNRTSMAQRDDVIKRTVYVSDIDHQVTEEQLAGLFLNCGQVVDCRICGDPNSVLRFAFVEFTDEDEREMCARTIYCTNIDKKVTQADVKLFFETICGEVHRLRLLGDYQHSTRIAFVEFVMAESAIAALNCSGVILGSLPIRVSPSKTPVRPRAPRSAVLH